MGFFDHAFDGAIGNVAGGVLGFLGQNSANSTNISLASANRSWQEYMSSTAHQREVADLRAAGLNPILSATGGSGASTPSGSVATVQNSLAPLQESFSRAINSALEYMNYDSEASLRKENERNFQSSAFANYTKGIENLRNAELSQEIKRKTSNEADASVLNTMLNYAKLDLMAAQAGSARSNSALSNAQIPYIVQKRLHEKVLTEADDLTKGEAQLVGQGMDILFDSLEHAGSLSDAGRGVWNSLKTMFGSFKKKGKKKGKGMTHFKTNKDGSIKTTPTNSLD